MVLQHFHFHSFYSDMVENRTIERAENDFVDSAPDPIFIIIRVILFLKMVVTAMAAFYLFILLF